MNVRYRVELSQAERAELTTLLSRGDESLGLLDRRDDRRGQGVDDRCLIAVHLLGGEDRRCACGEAGGRLGVTALRIGGEFKFLVEDDIGGFLALADPERRPRTTACTCPRCRSCSRIPRHRPRAPRR